MVCLNVSAKVGFNSCVVVALHARESPWAITRGNAHNYLIQLMEHLLLHLSCKSIFYTSDYLAVCFLNTWAFSSYLLLSCEGQNWQLMSRSICFLSTCWNMLFFLRLSWPHSIQRHIFAFCTGFRYSSILVKMVESKSTLEPINNTDSKGNTSSIKQSFRVQMTYSTIYKSS